jgi:hypothetical protein
MLTGKSSQAFTVRYGGVVNVLITKVGVSLPFNPSKNDLTSPEVKSSMAIWDTGATASVITEKMVKELSLKPVGMVEVRGVHGTKLKNVYLVNIYLPNNTAVMYVKVTECEELSGENLGILIGMDIISLGDVAITTKGFTALTYRCPSVDLIDFVELARMGIRKNNDVGRNDPCPCGSGQKYKKCCGK